MSAESRRMRRRLERDGHKAAVRDARAKGCTCPPTAARVIAWAGGAVPLFDFQHDAHCALLRSAEGPKSTARIRVLTLGDRGLGAMQAELLDRGRAA